MEKAETNRALWPFLIVSAAVSVALCLLLGYSGWKLVGMLAVWFCAAYAAMWLLFLVFVGVTSLFIDPKKPQKTYAPFFSGVTTYAMGMLCAAGRVRVYLKGAEMLPEGRWLLVCNHRSNFDPIVIGWALRKRRLAFISKPQNMRIPAVGRFLHKSCYLPIDRENDRAALRTILAAVDLMKRDVVSVGIFPEGRRNPGKELLPFRNGAFKIAQRAGAPIAVAAICGADDIHRRFPWRSTAVRLEIREIISAEAAAGMNTTEIGEEVRTCIDSSSC